MKKKLLIVIMLVLSCIGLCVGLAACGGSDTDGKYFAYKNGNYNEEEWIELDGDKWTTSDKEEGTFEITDKTIVFYADVFGSKEIVSRGTIENGVLTVVMNRVKTVYCKKGSAPSSSSENQDNSAAEKVTITYNANGGKFTGGSETFKQSADKGALLTAPASPSRTGYSFAGWAKSKNGSDMWKFDEDTAADGITLYAQWTEKSAVLLSVDGASIENDSVFMLVNSTVDAVSLSNKVVCSTDSVWRLYYDRLGQTEIPTKMAAGLSGSLANGNNTFYIVVTSQDGTQTNLYELTVHRSYAVTVGYYNGSQLLKEESVYTGSTFNANYTPTIEGYTFNGWKNSSGKKVTSFSVWGATQIYADKTAKQYQATFNVNGGDALTQDKQTVTYDSAYTLPVPTRTGYSFMGWYAGGTKLTGKNGASLARWGYAQNKTLTADWQANNYTLTVNSDNTSAGTVTGGGTYAYDSNVTLTATTNNGYTWLGWYNAKGEKVSSSLNYNLKMGMNATYTAKWIKVSIERNNTSAGSVTSLNGKYTVGEQATVTASTFRGYIWLGWYQDDTLLTDDLTFTFAMPSDNITYTAKWQVNEELQNFTFTSTATTLTVTGLKNKLVKEIVIPDPVTSIEAYAFQKCSSLRSVTIGNSVTSIKAYAFGSCKFLTSVTIGNSVTSIASGAFAYCYRLIEIYNKSTLTIKRGSYDNGSVAQYALNVYTQEGGGKPLTTDENGFVIYDGNTLVNYIGGQTAITIPNNVEVIIPFAFDGCSKLTSVTISDSVTSIGQYAFNDCSALRSVIFENTTGWTVSSTSIDSSNLSNPSTAAKYLTNNFKDRSWTRTEN